MSGKVKSSIILRLGNLGKVTMIKLIIHHSIITLPRVLNQRRKYFQGEGLSPPEPMIMIIVITIGNIIVIITTIIVIITTITLITIIIILIIMILTADMISACSLLSKPIASIAWRT